MADFSQLLEKTPGLVFFPGALIEALLGVGGTLEVVSTPNPVAGRDQRVWAPGSRTVRRPVARKQKRYCKTERPQ